MLMDVWCIPFLCVLFSARNAFGGNILIAIDLPSPSHQIWHYALAEGLIEKGHNVTLLGPFSEKGQKSDKYHPIVIEDVLKEIGKNPDYDLEASVSKMNALQMFKFISGYIYVICKFSYESKGFKRLLDYPPDFKFDLIIIDMTVSSCFYPFIQKFNYPPAIGSTAFLLPPFLSGTFGNELQSSYIPFYMLQYTEDMTFFQRVANYILTHLDYSFKQTYEMYQFGKLARQTFGDNTDSMRSLERRISLLLANINEAINQPQPVTPNIIPVGGLHIKASAELPKDIQTIMDNAKDGVILFCLGTNIRSDKLGTKAIEALLDAFSLLKQIVIWKFESGLENVPENVIIRQWVPQNSILAHPKVKLFISHGGALSTQEASYFGVPVIGMPFFMDQRINVGDMVDRKLAVKLEATTLTSQQVFDSINEILTNPIYAQNMKKVSLRMRDRQNTPLETAVFWSEYVMRHNGANFLSPKSRDLSHFVSSSTDVELFLIFLVFCIIGVFIIIFKVCRAYTIRKYNKKQKIQ